MFIFEGENDYLNNIEYVYTIFVMQWDLIHLNFLTLVISILLVSYYIFSWKIDSNIIGQFHRLSTQLKIYSDNNRDRMDIIKRNTSDDYIISEEIYDI